MRTGISAGDGRVASECPRPRTAEGRRHEDRGRVEDLTKHTCSLTVNINTKHIVMVSINNYICDKINNLMTM